MVKEIELFRADVARGIALEGEGPREPDVLQGVSVITRGEARGHDLEIDDTALEQVVQLGNSRKSGVKARFGHPGMSTESMGTFLGRMRSFRKTDGVVRADLHLDPTSHESPNGDLGAYVEQLAETDPEAFGASIVFQGTKEVRLDSEGNPAKNAAGEPLLPLVRIEKLHAVDVVDEPAANEGLFSTQWMTADCELSARLTQFVKKFLSRPKAVDQLLAFLKRYSSNDSPPQDQGDPQMGDTTEVTQETATVANATILSTPAAATFTFPAPAEDPIQTERKRVSEILSAAKRGQEDIAKKAIVEGMSLSDTLKLLLADAHAKQEAALAAIRKDTTPVVGPSEPDEPKVDLPKGEWTESHAKAAEAKWDAEPELQKEFHEKSHYVAYAKNVAMGRIKEMPE